jgi:hypothetical protein
MNDCLDYEIKRFGDDLSYQIQNGSLRIRGRHFGGSRYELTFPLADLRPELQIYWLRDSRAAVQASLCGLFLALFAIGVAVGMLAPPDVVAGLAPLILAALAASLALILWSVFPGRVESAAFLYRSGTLAFRVPKLGPLQGRHSLFVETLVEQIRVAAGGPT